MVENIDRKIVTVAFYTLGCKVNKYETDVMKESFINEGYRVIDFDINEKSDIYVINSCSVTNLSTRKTRNFINRAKKINKKSIVVLAGCYAQELKETENTSDIKIEADVIVGNEEKKNIVKYVNEYINQTNIKEDFKNNKENDINLGSSKKIYKISDINSVKTFNKSSSYSKYSQIRQSVKIEDGCDNFCSFCIIPYLRGRVRSRQSEDILNEINHLVIKGVKEVVLVGIEIASYGKEEKYKYSLIDLIEDISKKFENLRIRLRINRTKMAYL